MTSGPEAGGAATAVQADDGARRSILLAEYSSLRTEITTLLSLQGQFLNFSIVFFGFVVAMSNRTSGIPAEYVTLLPIPFGVLGLSYADVAFRILRVARYLHHEIRPQLNALGGGDCLQWEVYIRERHPNRDVMQWMDRLRWCFFLAPAVGFLALPFAIPPATLRSRWAAIAWATGALLFLLNVLAANRVGRVGQQITSAATVPRA
jgi:hypothetical protein